MNQKKITAKQAQLIAVTIIVVSVVTAAMIIGINNGQNLQKAMAQGSSPVAKEEANEYKNTAAASSSSTIASAAAQSVSPNQSTNKEFWINTVHFDGMTNLNAGLKCDTCPQNTPTHPPEQPPVNSTIP